MRRRRRLYRREAKKQGKVIIGGLFTVLLCLTIGYSAFNTNINLSAGGNVLDKSRVIQSWGSNSNEDFHTDFYRKNIISATFLDNAVVPSNAVEKWDVSESKDHGVMAYVIESTSETGKYDLYIGAKGGVIANANSSYLFDNNFDTSTSTDMSFMFHLCHSLTSLDVSNFDTKKVTNMEGMFCECRNLSILNLCSFDVSGVTNSVGMFKHMTNLNYVYVNDDFNIGVDYLFANSNIFSVTKGMC